MLVPFTSVYCTYFLILQESEGNGFVPKNDTNMIRPFSQHKISPVYIDLAVKTFLIGITNTVQTQKKAVVKLSSTVIQRHSHSKLTCTWIPKEFLQEVLNPFLDIKDEKIDYPIFRVLQ